MKRPNGCDLDATPTPKTARIASATTGLAAQCARRGPGAGAGSVVLSRVCVCRGLAGAGGAADADVRGGARRGGACPSADRAPAAAAEVPAAGRVPRRGGAAHAPGGRAPPGAAHRDPGRGAPAREARLSGLPDGVSVEPGRIEVRFSGAQDAVGRLFALAQALTHDYEQFEALVEAGEAAGGGGAGRA